MTARPFDSQQLAAHFKRNFLSISFPRSTNKTNEKHIRAQGCQMVYFQTKDPNLGKFWSVLQWKLLVNFVAIRSILLPFRIFYGLLVYFVVILAYFSRFGMLYQDKSGNPDPASEQRRNSRQKFPRHVFSSKQQQVRSWRRGLVVLSLLSGPYGS
jgi:hypothetical protein